MSRALALCVLMYRYRLWLRSLRPRGFTLIENAIILVLIGVLAAVAAPSFGQMLAKVELNKSVAAAQTSFSTAQRQAIRTRASCEVGILENRDVANVERAQTSSMVYGECLPGSDTALAEQTIVATNLTALPDLSGAGGLVAPNDPSKWEKEAYQWCVDHESHGHDYWDAACRHFHHNNSNRVVQMAYRPDGSVNFGIMSQAAYPIDPSGKMVFYNEGDAEKHQRCMVISRRLGLIRVGHYSGSLDPEQMTDQGTCQTDSWDQQTS